LTGTPLKGFAKEHAMEQTANLLNHLKTQIKNKGLTYKDIASNLKMSESSIKRLFSSQYITLQRLEEICSCIGITIFELTNKSPLYQKTKGNFLTYDQEKILADSPKLLCFYYLLLSCKSLKKIEENFAFSKQEIEKNLLLLNRCNLLDLYPKNNYLLNNNENITFLSDGPLSKKYTLEMRKNFFLPPFRGSRECFRTVRGCFSDHTIALLNKKIDRFIREIEELVELEDHSEQDNSHYEMGIVLAMRPWKFDIIEQYKRK
jgi:transcriptional regulator with XRE-family HTH domain